MAGNDYRMHDAEAMLLTKVCAEMVFWNPRTLVLRFFVPNVVRVMLIAVVVLLLAVVVTVVVFVVVFVAVFVMIMLCEGRHSGENSKRQEPSKTDSNHFHLVKIPLRNEYRRY